MPTDYVENINSTSKGRYLLLAKKPRIIARGTEGRHSRVILIDQQILNEKKTKRKHLVMALVDYKNPYGMVPQSWIINYLKMYKISDDVINFIEKAMKTWKVEQKAGGGILAEAKVQRGIFQGDVLLPLLFIVAMMPLNHILRKCTARYKLSRSKESINHLMYMDDIKLFVKMKKNWKF